jgi:hypothetical protein
MFLKNDLKAVAWSKQALKVTAEITCKKIQVGLCQLSNLVTAEQNFCV